MGKIDALLVIAQHFPICNHKTKGCLSPQSSSEKSILKITLSVLSELVDKHVKLLHLATTTSKQGQEREFKKEIEPKIEEN